MGGLSGRMTAPPYGCRDAAQGREAAGREGFANDCGTCVSRLTLASDIVCRPTCSESRLVAFVAFKAGTMCRIQNTGAIVQVKLEGRLISQIRISTPHTALKPAPEPALKRSRLAFVAAVTAHQGCPRTLQTNNLQSIVKEI